MAIPCLRSSTLTGFGASFGAGILHFLCTSNGVKAFQFAKITFFVVTFPYWYILQTLLSYLSFSFLLTQQVKIFTGSIAVNKYIRNS